MRESLERYQAWIYLASLALGAGLGAALPSLAALESLLTPALALMLFATFLQVPLTEIGRGLRATRFLAALLASNFIAIPCFVALLLLFAPPDASLRLGLLMVLLAPCIDYVITFAHLGRADARLLLAATPILLVVQMALLPSYLSHFLGPEAGEIIAWRPFLEAFLAMIALPLACAGAVQFWAKRQPLGARVEAALGLLPVPATALVLFLVAAVTLPLMGGAWGAVRAAIPLYFAFALIAPLIGWAVGRGFGLEARASRAVAFSSATRNSLVILPLALAIPEAMPMIAAVIVAQTLVELVAELLYIRLLQRLG